MSKWFEQSSRSDMFISKIIVSRQILSPELSVTRCNLWRLRTFCPSIGVGTKINYSGRNFDFEFKFILGVKRTRRSWNVQCDRTFKFSYFPWLEKCSFFSPEISVLRISNRCKVKCTETLDHITFQSMPLWRLKKKSRADSSKNSN